MSTPGKRRALKALGARRRSNKRRIAKGQKPIIGGERVSLATFRRRTGPKKKKRQNRRRK